MNYPSGTQTPTPDLASILKTLSQHTNSTNLTTTTTTHRDHSTPQHQNYNNNHNHNQPYNHTQSHSRNHHQNHHAYPQQSPHPQAAPIPIPGPISGKPPTDPSRLTTYPAALRYTSALLASNAQLTHRIKALIRSQHDHERQWWAGRALIPDECRKRVESRKAVADVLRRLNQNANVNVNANVGIGTGDGGGGDDESIETALREYDRKVHSKCLEMQRDARRQLKECGIPGFVVRSELVGDGPGQVSRDAIMELEGRMLLLLEDLCRD